MESSLFAKMIVLQVELSDDPTVIKEYIDYHDNIWPEIVTDLKDRPIGRMRIYNLGNRLVMLLEVGQDFDLKEGIHIQPPNNKVSEWGALMGSLLKKLDSGEYDEWTEMNKVWDTEKHFSSEKKYITGSSIEEWT